MTDLKSLLLGRALRNDQIKGEKMSVIWGLPIMASDAVSSVAYGVEEILLALVPALGLLATGYTGMIGATIVFLLLLLVFSYSQIINHYPNGGGSYAVSKENFGRNTSLLAAACLMVDYIMTVSVSISSSTAAIVSAYPVLEGLRVEISLLSLAIVTLINLRGVRESSKIFGVPTYLFIISMFILIITGFTRLALGNLHPIAYTAEQAAAAAVPANPLSAITLVLFLRAFASGCSALTGVEAVSNAVPSFRDPPIRTAKRVLYLLGLTIVFTFGGTCFLAASVHVISLPAETIMSQMGNVVFGRNIMYYMLQFTTSLILLLAANTAYNGLPILLAICAKDQYMPRQFAQRGTKLSFSNGIMFICIAGAILIIAFKSDTHALIPFYAVGVLVSFTLSQGGMFVKWRKLKEKGWQYKSLINGFGALVTGISVFVVFFAKFTHGAWALAIVIPLIILFMLYTHKHYERFGKAVSMNGNEYHYKPSKSNDKLPCIVLIHNINQAAFKTFDYAQEISSDVTALHMSTTPHHTEALKDYWEKHQIGVPLVIIPAPYRDILTPLDQYITEREAELKPGEYLTVVLTKFVGNGWRDRIFHNQTSFFIASKLDHHKYVTTVLVPYQYNTEKVHG